MPIEERAEFPRAGYRARRFVRFERDLRRWLATPSGRFARWCAVPAPLGDTGASPAAGSGSPVPRGDA